MCLGGLTRSEGGAKACPKKTKMACALEIAPNAATIVRIACTFAAIGLPSNFTSRTVRFRGCQAQSGVDYLVRSSSNNSLLPRLMPLCCREENRGGQQQSGSRLHV